MGNDIPTSLARFFLLQGVFGLQLVPKPALSVKRNGVSCRESVLIVARDYKSLLGARIMQGFGTGPFEMLVPSSIGDMYLCPHPPDPLFPISFETYVVRYFVHQRGKRIALQAMSMFGVSFFTPIVTGVITERMYAPTHYNPPGSNC
jgi:MFS family permease